MDIKLNWLGIHVSDFAASLRFYTHGLGMNASSIKPDWAYFDTTGMTFELFGGGSLPVSGRSAWGQGHAVRPGIQVSDLSETVSELRRRGVQFTGETEKTAFSEWIEFIAPENMHWTLAQAPSFPFSQSLQRPHIGWLELKVNRLAEQQAFYRDVLGLKPEDAPDGRVVLRQGPGEPLLFMESGGERHAPLQINQGMFQPLPSHLISFETDDILEAADWLRSHQVPILIEITRKDWGGIDLYIADPDGNPIQVVQYLPRKG
jgi:catechol 2,3-dioxygenase-like lactoylglutathione lyase family enzyme